MLGERQCERRATIRAFACWLKLCADAPLPRGLAAIDDCVPATLRDALFVLRLDAPSERGRIVRTGQALARLGGAAMLDRPLADAGTWEFGEVLGDLAHNVARYRKPLPSSGATRMEDGRLALYRGILLPIADDDGEVIAALGAIGCTPLLTAAVAE